MGVVDVYTPNISQMFNVVSDTLNTLGENQIKILDAKWQNNFETQTSQYINNKLNSILQSGKKPDLDKFQEENKSYIEGVLSNVPERLSINAKAYYDQKNISAFEILRKQANKIEYKENYDAYEMNVLNELNNFDNFLTNIYDTSENSEEIFDAIDSYSANELSLFLGSHSEKYDSLIALSNFELSTVDKVKAEQSLLKEIESKRVNAIIKGFYKNVDSSNVAETSEADLRAGVFLRNYALDEGGVRGVNYSVFKDETGNSIGQVVIDEVVNEGISTLNTIKSLNKASFQGKTKQEEYENIILKQKLVDAIYQNDINSMTFLLTNDEKSLFPQLSLVGESNNEDLIKTFLDKKETLNYLEDLSNKETININNVHKYYSHIKYNLGVASFENEKDLEEFVKSYQLNKVNLNSIIKTGQSYTQADWFDDLGKDISDQKQGTILMNNMIRNEGIVFSELQSELNSIYNILGKGEYDIDDVNKITNIYQGWEFITNENPIAVSNMDEVDNSFFLYVQKQGGLKALELQGAASLYQSYLKKVDFEKSNKDNIVLIQNEILNDPLIQEGIDGQLLAEMTDAILKDEALNTMFMPLWNSIMKNPEYEFSTENPLSSFLEVAPGIVSLKGGDVADLNFLQQTFVKGNETIWRLFDFLNPLSNDFYTKNFTTSLYRVKPAVRDEINKSILNQLENYMDVSLFVTDPEEAKRIFADKGPDIMKTVIKNMADNNYSITVLGSEFGKPELVKYGYETEMTKAGYNEDTMMTRTAYDIAVLLKDYSEKNGQNYMLENFGFLYFKNGEYNEPSISDIKKSLKNGDFSIRTIKGANQPIYEVYINHPDTTLQGMPLGTTGNEKIVIEPFSEDQKLYVTPLSKKQINESIVTDLIQDPNSLFNSFEPFKKLPENIKKYIVKTFTLGRPGTEVFLEPLIEIISGGRYDYKSIKDELDKYIDIEYKKLYEDYVD